MKSPLAVIATYNEADNIRGLVARIGSLEVEIDILIVDDSSPDGTGQIADRLAAQFSSIYVLHRTRTKGLGPALCQGFSWALDRGYEKILNLDGDLSHNPDDIPFLLSTAEKADLVIGSRYVNGIRVINWPPHRVALSLLAASYVCALTGMPIKDPTSGFRCFRREALRFALSKPPLSVGYSIHFELLHRIWRHQMRVTEVPIFFTDRVEGTTKMNTRIIMEALWITPRLLIQNRLRRSAGRDRYVNRQSVENHLT